MGSLYNGMQPDDVGFMEEINKLVPQFGSASRDESGVETWACAWSPDGSLFAWSYGKRCVKVIPWTRIKERQPVFTDEERVSESQYIELNEQERQEHRKRSVENSGNVVTIDCGYTVRSLAFGSREAQTLPGSINMKRFRYVDDMILGTGLSNGRMRIWDVTTGGLLWELMDHKGVVNQLKFCPNGNLVLASACFDGTIKLWDMKDDGNMFKTLRACSIPSFMAYSCAWERSGKYLASVGTHKTAVIWNMETYKIYRKLEGHHYDVVDCDFSPDGALLATCSFDTRCILWDTHTGDQLHDYCHLYPPPHPIFAGGSNGFYVRSLSMSRDGLHLASLCEDGYLRIWDLSKEELPEKLAEIEGLTCAYGPSGDVIAVGTRTGTVSFYKCPMRASSLKVLCRMALRSNVDYSYVDKLPVPIRVREFLKYRVSL